jgi:hypothetical protein
LAVLSKLCIRDAPPQNGVFPDPAPPQPVSLRTRNAGFYYTRKAVSQCHLSALQFQFEKLTLSLQHTCNVAREAHEPPLLCRPLPHSCRLGGARCIRRRRCCAARPSSRRLYQRTSTLPPRTLPALHMSCANRFSIPPPSSAAVAAPHEEQRHRRVRALSKRDAVPFTWLLHLLHSTCSPQRSPSQAQALSRHL